MLIGRYNGINESAVYKVPPKLPAIVMFRRGSEGKEGEEKERTEMKGVEEMMVRKVDRERGEREIKKFIERSLK